MTDKFTDHSSAVAFVHEVIKDCSGWDDVQSPALAASLIALLRRHGTLTTAGLVIAANHLWDNHFRDDAHARTHLTKTKKEDRS